MNEQCALCGEDETATVICEDCRDVDCLEDLLDAALGEDD
jgi:hypothetical protein